MPGPELHLNAMNALLTGEFCTMTSQLTAAICLVGAALIAWLIGIITHRPDSRLLCGLGIPALWWWLAVVVYEKQGYFIPTVAPTVVFLFIALSSMVADQVFERVEKARVRRTLERYVSKNVVGGLLDRRDEFATGVVMPVTVLFSDVRNFTRFSAQTEPHALVAQLNEYFTAMVECVFQHGGTVDKFMGDAVMAVWGNAMSKGIQTDARDAARCAFAMREALTALNARWKSEGRSEFEIGIALNHGRAVVGDIGSPNKMEFTVIGDAVNIAWRLQECTKDHPREIIVGDTVAGLLDAEFQATSVGSIRVGDEIDVPYSIVKRA
jgi:adenylate cyclase